MMSGELTQTSNDKKVDEYHKMNQHKEKHPNV